MTETVSPAPVTPSTRRRTRLWAALSAGVVLVLVVGSAALGLSLRGSGKPAAAASPSPSPSPSPLPYGFEGGLTLKGMMRWQPAGPGLCTGAMWLVGVRAGAPVVVSDRDGTPLGVGELRDGHVVNQFDCLFAFTVERVPRGRGVYSIKVADLDPTNVAELTFEGWSYALALTVG